MKPALTISRLKTYKGKLSFVFFFLLCSNSNKRSCVSLRFLTLFGRFGFSFEANEVPGLTWSTIASHLHGTHQSVTQRREINSFLLPALCPWSGEWRGSIRGLRRSPDRLCVLYNPKQKKKNSVFLLIFAALKVTYFIVRIRKKRSLL